MPVLQDDFDEISSSFESLDEGDYRFRLTEIEDQSEDSELVAQLRAKQKMPALIFKSEVVEGKRKNSIQFDYVYLTTKDGKKNKVGLGRIKAYAEAILGKEAANGKSIDTDALVNGEFIGYIKQRTYKAPGSDEVKTSSDLKKILPVG